MTPTQRALGFIAMLILLRAAVAAFAPLAFDEAYYWLWSKHLAAGYLDHPPLIAFAIRGGTALFGDTPFGVRFVPFLALMAASWGVWRAGAIVLASEESGALAALLFNLTLMVNIEGLVATPDAPAMAAAAFFLFSLVKVSQTERGAWWLAAGAAGGFALLAKYTAPFLGAGAILWLVVSPRERHWLRSPWPYLGAMLALVMFAPVVLWNWEHGWISFAKQFGRVGAGQFTLRYLGEFLAGQLGLATPFIALLGVAGLSRLTQTRTIRPVARGLIVALMVPAALYFLWHSLHDRVQGNWPSFLYPALCIAAAAAWNWRGDGLGARTIRLLQKAAIPFAALLTLAIYAHVFRPLAPLAGLRDPIARLLAVGYEPVAERIDTLRHQAGAQGVITTSYAQTGWLAFYLPSHPPVMQFNERERWLNEPPSPESVFAPQLYVTETWRDEKALLAQHFGDITLLARIPRLRDGRVIEDYAVYRVAQPLAAQSR